MMTIAQALPLWLVLSAPALAAPDYSELIGSWRVTDVAVQPGPVQAVIDNDPQFMDARLAFRQNGISWLRGTSERAVNIDTDNCRSKPRLTSTNSSVQDADFRFKYGFNDMR